MNEKEKILNNYISVKRSKKLSPLTHRCILLAMAEYAKHYHKKKIKSYFDSI